MEIEYDSPEAVAAVAEYVDIALRNIQHASRLVEIDSRASKALLSAFMEIAGVEKIYRLEMESKSGE